MYDKVGMIKTCKFDMSVSFLGGTVWVHFEIYSAEIYFSHFWTKPIFGCFTKFSQVHHTNTFDHTKCPELLIKLTKRNI